MYHPRLLHEGDECWRPGLHQPTSFQFEAARSFRLRKVEEVLGVKIGRALAREGYRLRYRFGVGGDMELGSA